MNRDETTGSVLHPLVGGFTDARTYDAGRPRYGRETVELLMSHLHLAAGSPVLELGAGTGQLSAALVAAGLDLTAVEPLAATRGLLAERIGQERVREGTAEQIPLDDGSVDAVFAADSFHWFDETRAMPEIKRVLRAEGGVAILRMAAVEDLPWSRELGTILVRSRPDHPAFSGRGPAAALEEDPAFGPVVQSDLRVAGEMGREQLIAWIASFSWVAVLPVQEREALLSQAREVLARHGVERSGPEVLHQIWVSRLR